MDLLTVPPDAVDRLRERLRLRGGEQLRVSYLPGTGDVVGTYSHWRDGRHDPRVPVITYSAMFYELMTRLKAAAQIVTPWPEPPVDTGNFTFHQVTRERSSSRPRDIANKLQHIRASIAAVNAFRPHVVVADLDFQPLGWRWLKKDRSLIVSAHNTFWPMGRRPPGGLKSWLKTTIVSSQASAVDRAVCTSEECRRQISELTKGRVDGFVEFPQVVRSYEAEQREIARKLLYLGRIEVDKGVFLLLDAFLGLGEAGSDLELIFAGSGTAEDELTSRIAASGKGNVRFVGRLDAEDVHRAIAASDLIVCPTTSWFNEGLALVGFEGAAHGIPSLVSSVVPAADGLGQGCEVFEADSMTALREGIRSLATDRARYRALAQGALAVRHKLYERERSWGSQLCSALLSLEAR